jgi:hypothetical protein
VSTRNSYAPGTSPPSNSYGVEAQFPGTMKLSLPPLSRTTDLAAPPVDSPAAFELPQPGAVLFEIGLVLGIHLAVALGVTLSLRALGIT